jgi:SAM-dependent methyltransferase
MNRESKDHWDAVYEKKGPERVSWFRSHLEQSLLFLDRANLPLDAAIIDVGGGASTFVDDVLDRGYRDVTILDISAAALDVAHHRLGPRSSAVHWICGDVTEVRLPERAFDFWHDRAVFHFLSDPEDRARYVENVRRSVRPGGHVLVATFGPHGPEQCSGLEVVRYTPESLHSEFGDDFSKVGDATELHVTPSGTEQEFIYCYCRISA